MELKVNDTKLIETIFNGDAPDIYFAPDVDTIIAEKKCTYCRTASRERTTQAET